MEYFGFSLYVGATLLYIGVLIWSATPKQWFELVSIYYWPSRWWALACPAFVLVLLGYIYVALAAYNTEVLTRPPTSLETICDPAANIEQDGRHAHQYTNAVKDLPLSQVNAVLYSEVK